MKLVERSEPQAAINDVVVQVHASGFVGTELAWPSTWTDRRGRSCLGRLALVLAFREVAHHHVEDRCED